MKASKVEELRTHSFLSTVLKCASYRRSAEVQVKMQGVDARQTKCQLQVESGASVDCNYRVEL